jgi:peptidoglycan-associated lipoprotein
MTRCVHLRWLSRGLIVAAGLTVALTGCAARSTTGAGANATGAGTTGAGADGHGQGSAGAGGGTGAGSQHAGGHAPGATVFPTLPAPHEFNEAAGLRDVHFDFDRATLRPEDGRILDANARWLLAHSGTLILIEGHADERGTNEYNLSLGENRARVTRDQLVARGVVASRITILSYGEERPKCKESSEACWANNRRAHFLVKSAVTVSDARK